MGYMPETISSGEVITSEWGNKVEQMFGRLGNYLGVVEWPGGSFPSDPEVGDWVLFYNPTERVGKIMIYYDGLWLEGYAMPEDHAHYVADIRDWSVTSFTVRGEVTIGEVVLFKGDHSQRHHALVLLEFTSDPEPENRILMHVSKTPDGTPVIDVLAQKDGSMFTSIRYYVDAGNVGYYALFALTTRTGTLTAHVIHPVGLEAGDLTAPAGDRIGETVISYALKVGQLSLSSTGRLYAPLVAGISGNFEGVTTQSITANAGTISSIVFTTAAGDYLTANFNTYTNTLYVASVASIAGSLVVYGTKNAAEMTSDGTVIFYRAVEAPYESWHAYPLRITAEHPVVKLKLPQWMVDTNNLDTLRVFIQPVGHWGRGTYKFDKTNNVLVLYLSRKGEYDVLLMARRKDLYAAEEMIKAEKEINWEGS